MIVGLPGTGIGGLFYLLSALWMPVREAWRAATGRAGAARWRAVAKLAALAAAIFASLWLTAVALDLLVPATQPASAAGGAAESASSSIGVTASYVTLATLAVVLVTVEIAAVVVRRWPAGRRPVAESAD